MKVKITKRAVDALVATNGRLFVTDTDLAGFGMIVTPAGSKSYIVEYRPGAGGRSAPKRRVTIGQHGSPWTPDTARDEAKRILGLVAVGRDPAADKADARRKEGTTVQDIATAFIEKYAKARQKSWQETERVFRNDVYPAFGSKPVQEVTRQDIVRLVDTVAERGPIMANRTLAYVRKFFNWCIERGYITATPCAGIKPPGAAKARERVLDDGELAEVWRAAEAIGGNWEGVVKLLILTAQRREEVVAMRWDELDLDGANWTLPGERTKNKRGHEVPLVATAVAALRMVPRLAGCSFVFSTTGLSAMSGWSRAKSRLDAAIAEARSKAGNSEPMPGWTFHDLRRTATTGMARLGIHPHIADAILNHKTGSIQGVAATYNRHGYLGERRCALQSWEAHVWAKVKGGTVADNVIKLKVAS
jgi:integrase